MEKKKNRLGPAGDHKMPLEDPSWNPNQWEDPDKKRKQQLKWTRLPQGFTESPNLFGQALEELLGQFTPEKTFRSYSMWMTC